MSRSRRSRRVRRHAAAPKPAPTTMPEPSTPPPPAAKSTVPLSATEPPVQAGQLEPYDEHLLDRARTQWQFGDWDSLAQLSIEQIQHHPERARLALLAAAGYQQLGSADDTRHFARMAHEWGCERRLIGRVLISGVYNTLGRANALAGRQNRARQQIETALAVGAPGQALTLLTAARLQYQFDAKGLPKPALSQQVRDADTALLAQDSKTQPSVPALFYCRVTLNGQSLQLGFNPSTTQHFKRQSDTIVCELPPDKPGYLVTNETGNFNHSPTLNPLPLAPDTAYELTGTIAGEYFVSPIIFLFQYTVNDKLIKQSVTTESGRFKLLLRTRHDLSACALGIRLKEPGTLNIPSITIQINSGLEITTAEQIQSQISQLGQRIEATLAKTQKQHSDNSLMQIESFIRLQNYMGSDLVMPEMHAWPISPDLGVLLIRLVEEGDYDAVIEFGSGVSTLILAKALTKKADHTGNLVTPFLSFDHLQQFYDQTAQLLQRGQLRESVQLELAPLIAYQGPDGKEYRYYDCGEPLRALHKALSKPQPRLLVLIDGPPGKTGPQARYPALPVLFQIFGRQARMELVMDDYQRDDERAIIDAWEHWLTKQGVDYKRQAFLKLEKQACLLKVEATC